MTCTCQTCTDLNRWLAGINNDDTSVRMAVFMEVLDRIEHAETAVVHYKSILNGTWPNAQLILATALQRVKEINEIPKSN